MGGADREAVFVAIEGERHYQDQKWPQTRAKTNAEYLLYIEDYLAEAKRSLCRTPDAVCEPVVKHSLRKIAALAVAAMEENGMLLRGEEGARPVGARY